MASRYPRSRLARAITDKIIDTVKAWQQRPLDSHYPFVWTGLTIGASWSQLEIFRPLNTRRCIISNSQSHPRRHDSHTRVAGLPGAIQADKAWVYPTFFKD